MSVSRPDPRPRWTVILLAVVGLLAVAVFDNGGEPTDAERVQSLSTLYACPTCDGQSVAESNAAVAATIRDLIRLRVSTGASDEQIRDELLRSYGTDVLLTPPSDGFSALIWVLPAVVAILGVAGLFVVVRRSGSRRKATAADVELVEQARNAGVSDG